MVRLTTRQVRIRAALMVLAFALTLSLIVAAVAFAEGSAWLLPILMLIDVPVFLLLGVAEWYERSHA